MRRDASGVSFAETATLGAVGEVLKRNALVVALHGFACVAGFIAGSSLPEQADRYSGLYRRVHDRAGPLAITFVIAATAFSLATQAFALGAVAATLAAQGGTSPALQLLGLLPHAVPELVALFLPLRHGSWPVAGATGTKCSRRRSRPSPLAVPVLVVAAFVEVYVSPQIIVALRG